MLKHYCNLCKFSYRTKQPDISWGRSNIALLRRNILCIRGTNSIWDLVSDANIVKTKSSCGKVKFHRGFYNSAKTLVDKIEKQQLLNKKDTYRICGHSAGGAIGVIAAYELQLKNYNIEEVVSFGSPKVTDTDGCKFLENYVNYLRITYEEDIFVSAPPNIFGNKFDHFGKVIESQSEKDMYEILNIHSMQNYCYLTNCD